MSSKKDNIKSLDIQFMKLALSIARNNEGLTGENPSVGCVVTKNNNIISSGTTSINGRPHAETNALQNLNKNAENSTIYITMEPCTHYGKTPPCTDIIIKSKIKRVVYAVEDKDERTAHKASIKLKRHGINVTKSVCKEEARNFYRKYFFNKKYKVPYVTGKIACSKDNYIKSKKKRYISDDTSLNVGHLLRYKNDGILISHKTINEDNPSLNCRLNGLEKYSPKVFIIDKNLSIKHSSNVINSVNRKNTYIFHGSTEAKKIKYLKKMGVNLMKISLDNDGSLSLLKILKTIYKKNVYNLLVEGGRSLTKLFLDKNYFNQFYLFKSNKTLKSSGLIKISNILVTLGKKFKSKKVLDTFSNKDKIIKFI